MLELHERCLRCGRKLKSDESKVIGYGPVCLEKAQSEKATIPLFSMPTNVSVNNDAINVPNP